MAIVYSKMPMETIQFTAFDVDPCCFKHQRDCWLLPSTVEYDPWELVPCTWMWIQISSFVIVTSSTGCLLHSRSYLIICLSNGWAVSLPL
jgi:hypothetical protein